MNRKVNKIVLLVASIVVFVAILVLLTLAEPEEEPSDYRGQVSSSSSLDNELKFESEELKYEFAEYEKYNSDGNGGKLKGNRICIRGEILTICDDVNKSLIHISAAKTNNGDWIIELPKLKNSAKLINYIRDKNVICYGTYTGIESNFNLPTLSPDELLFDEKIFDYKSYNYNEFLELDKFLSDTEEATVFSTEPPTEAPTSAPTEAPTEQTYPVIFTSDEIEISYFDVKESKYEDDELEVYFLINNKTDRVLMFQADTVILNGISYNDIVMSDPISPGTKGTICAQVENMMILPETITSVGGELRYFDSNSYGSDGFQNKRNVSILETQI